MPQAGRTGEVCWPDAYDALAMSAIENLITKSGQDADEIVSSISADPASLSMAALVVERGLFKPKENHKLVCNPQAQNAAAEAFAKSAISSAEDGSLWSKYDPSRILWTIMRASPGLAKKMFAALKRQDPSHCVLYGSQLTVLRDS